MKFYFCGSIRGGRQRANLYHTMIEKMKEYGVVLTEHVGDPALTNLGGDGGSDYIWQRDMAWLRDCDAVIAECTVASLGVGYEIAAAVAMKKPVYVLYAGEPGRLSAMVAGDPSIRCFDCATEDEELEILQQILDSLPSRIAP